MFSGRKHGRWTPPPPKGQALPPSSSPFDPFVGRGGWGMGVAIACIIRPPQSKSRGFGQAVSQFANMSVTGGPILCGPNQKGDDRSVGCW